MRIALTIFLTLLHSCLWAQFAPQAGLAGNTAIPAGSASFVAWGTSCSVERGYIDIADPGAGTTTAGTVTDATGAPDGAIISLGDSGIATITFGGELYNGAGYDFAVFENGFRNPADSAMAFLELAFVEVSSDGTHFVRFPSTSLVPVNTQIPGSGVYTNASMIDGLAGKYIAQYGTPFDLDILKDSTGLAIDHITHVRIIDVIGSVGAHASHDAQGNIINDPYPTNFPTGGFDLDAVGAIHLNPAFIRNTTASNHTTCYPNPASSTLHFAMEDEHEISVAIYNPLGACVQVAKVSPKQPSISLQNLTPGIYTLSITNHNGEQWVERISKY